jgi:hypothetical protein
MNPLVDRAVMGLKNDFLQGKTAIAGGLGTPRQVGMGGAK